MSVTISLNVRFGETVLLSNGNSQNDLVKYLRSKAPLGWRMTGAEVKVFLFVIALIDLLACG